MLYTLMCVKTLAQAHACVGGHGSRRRVPQVASFYSTLGKKDSKLPDKTGVAICTIEKANALVTRMIEDGVLGGTFSAVIVDELHMVDDEDRGYLLELLLTKLLHVARLQKEGGADGQQGGRDGLVTQALGSAEPGSTQEADVQLIGMSATLPNLPLIGHWLSAAVYETVFRPVRRSLPAPCAVACVRDALCVTYAARGLEWGAACVNARSTCRAVLQAGCRMHGIASQVHVSKSVLQQRNCELLLC